MPVGIHAEGAAHRQRLNERRAETGLGASGPALLRFDVGLVVVDLDVGRCRGERVSR